jgi:hypothetical protein
VVLFRENHISGAGESCEVGNPAALGMTKERVVFDLDWLLGAVNCGSIRSDL